MRKRNKINTAAPSLWRPEVPTMRKTYIRELFEQFGLLPLAPGCRPSRVEVRRPAQGRLSRGPRPGTWLGKRLRGTHRLVRHNSRP